MTGALVMFSAALLCNQPSEFFAPTNGLDALLNAPVPARYVFDVVPPPTNKVLRVAPQTAAFYYSFLSGYMERELLLGYLRGNLGDDLGPANRLISAPEAFRLMQSGNLPWAFDVEEELKPGSNRVVRSIGRFAEGDTTSGIVSRWLDSRRDEAWYYDNHSYTVPRYFQGAPIFSVDFTYISMDTPDELHTFVDDSLLSRSFVTWQRLEPTDFGRMVSAPMSFVLDGMRRNCERDQRPGSPATWATGAVQRVSQTFTNLVNELAPGCYGNLTNQTRRLDYKRIAAISQLMGIEDRKADPQPFGHMWYEGDEYTNYVEVAMQQSLAAAVTNVVLAQIGFDEDSGYMLVRFSDVNVEILTNKLVAATNMSALVEVCAAANRSEIEECLDWVSGGARLEYSITCDELKEYAEVGKGYFCEAVFDDLFPNNPSVLFEMRKINAYTPEYSGRIPIGWFACSNVAMSVSRFRQGTHAWTLDPSKVPDRCRYPSVDSLDVHPEASASASYPRWLYGNLVESFDLFTFGNMVRHWGEQTANPSYSQPGYDTPEDERDEAWYYFWRDYGLSYSGFFDALWGRVGQLQPGVESAFQSATGTRLGRLDELQPDRSLDDTLESMDWYGPLIGQGVAVTPKHLAYLETVSQSGMVSTNFYAFSPDTHVTNSTPVDVVSVHFLSAPSVKATNNVGRAVSIGATIDYMGGINAIFKNLVPER